MRLIPVLLLVLTAGCDSRPAPDAELVNLKSVPPDTEIKLSRGQCYGTCPVYQLAVDAKGNVRFVGIQHVAAKGERHHKISEEALLRLIHHFGRIGYLGIDKAQLEATCREPSTDHASVFTSLTIAGRKNQIDNDHGCPKGPLRDGLHALEKEIDRFLADPAWLRRAPEGGPR